MNPVSRKYLKTFLEIALKEDLGAGDITTDAVFKKDFKAKAIVIAKETGVVCGNFAVVSLAKLVSKAIRVTIHVVDGKRIRKGQKVLTIEGPVKAILRMERLSLNLMGRLSGIATLTSQFVAKTKKYKVKVYDTRKTTPLLRALEKFAIVCGGGENHRFGLFDQVLIKDNHVWGWTKGLQSKARSDVSLKEMVWQVRKKIPTQVPIEIEVDNLSQLKDAIRGEPDMIMLDNMRPKALKQCVAYVKDYCRKTRIKKPLLEASGGINLKNISQVAATGIDMISIGALTHSVPNFDFSLDVK